jgi:hypothetical protein
MNSTILQGKRRQDVILLILAIILFFSPWVLSFAHDGAAKWNAAVFGIVLAYFACASLSESKQWEEWVTVVLGVWVVAAPWVLRFTADNTAARVHWGVGALVIIASLWAEWRFRHPPSLSAR